tara:strand:- start:113 stop:295 length:183 start_codon:yes stop_codon:yes gene_type:complete
MNYQQVATLLAYLREMSDDAPNAPDLELALDFIEIEFPEVPLTDAVINYVDKIITANFPA